MKLWMISILLVSLGAVSQGSDILMLAPFGTWSDYQLTKAIADTLAVHRHQVTLVSGFNTPKVQDSDVKEIFIGSSGLEDQNMFELDTMNLLSNIVNLQKKITHMMYTNKDVVNIWKNRNKFDAIIAYCNGNEMSAPFLLDYHGVYIGLSPLGMQPDIILNQGNRLPKSVTPSSLLHFEENMNFFERVSNLVIDFLVTTMYFQSMMPQLQVLLENYFPGMPSAVSLYSNYSLLLMNSHYELDGIYPLLPNQVEIGTLTATRPQPLPKDLEEFVDGAEHGVIYFSLGINAKSKDIPNMQMAMLLEAFSHLPQRVIWKFEGDHIGNIPANVIIRKWLPQQDVLGHPKTLVFISHCGNFGIQEAKYHGVPVLGVPIAIDQHRNAARLAKKGFGRVLNWDEMTVDAITENINTLIKDTSYRNRIQAVSRTVQNPLVNPKDRALWWIEHAIRHNGTPHMHYAGKNLNAIQYHMIDVWAFLIAMMLLWITLTSWCLRRCYRKVFNRERNPDNMDNLKSMVNKKTL